MPKKLKTTVKLQIPAGKANPAPPIGTALGPHGVAIGDFCNQYNEATKDKIGQIIPVIINVYEDRSFDFILKTPPASDLLKKAAKIEKGSGNPNLKKAGKVTKAQIKEIAEIKLPDLNTKDINAAIKIIEGTAKQMGIEIR